MGATTARDGGAGHAPAALSAETGRSGTSGAYADGDRAAGTSGDVDALVQLRWGEPFRRQLRVGLGLVGVGNLAYGVANAVVRPPAVATMLGIQALHLAVIVAGLIYLGRPRSWRALRFVGFFEASYACLSTAVVGAAAGRSVSTAATVATIAFMGPALLPWGAETQTALALVGMAALVANSWLLSGTAMGAIGLYPVIGFAVALAGSVYVADALDRARRSVAEEEERRNAAQAELRALTEDLERRIDERTAAVNAAFGELQSFTYTVSHDLRSPLRGINGLARIILEDAGSTLDDDTRTRIDRICTSTRRMDAMIDAVLSLGRVAQTELRHRDLDLSDLARSIVADLQAAEPDRRVDWRIADGVHAHGDPTFLAIVVGNLLENAWKYTRDVDAPRIEFGAETGGDQPIYFVRDNGRGIAMDYAERAFEPFVRLDASDADPVEGTGIGLTTVRRIVERHGGRVWIDSAPGEGATFRFTLRAKP